MLDPVYFFSRVTKSNFIHHNFTRKYMISSIWLLFWYSHSVFAYIASKVVPPEKNDEALQLLTIIWKAIAKKPKKEIDNIIRGSGARKQESKPGNQVSCECCVRIHSEKGPIASTSKSQNTKKIVYPSRILFVAAKMGNTKFVVELIRLYPDLIWKVDDKNRSIFHIAVKHRHEGIYNILYEIGSMKDLITPLKDADENNMLHLVGKSAKKKRLQDVSGVAFQMQRELLWFNVQMFLSFLSYFFHGRYSI